MIIHQQVFSFGQIPEEWKGLLPRSGRGQYGTPKAPIGLDRTVVIMGALIGIPAAKLLIDSIFPMFVANVACTVHLEYRWYHYVLLFAGILLIYQLISMLFPGSALYGVPYDQLSVDHSPSEVYGGIADLGRDHFVSLMYHFFHIDTDRCKLRRAET